MTSITEVVRIDVQLAKDEIEAIGRMFSGKAKFEILKDAQLSVRVRVEVPKKMPEAKCGQS
jgi:hypothetical protein